MVDMRKARDKGETKHIVLKNKNLKRLIRLARTIDNYSNESNYIETLIVQDLMRKKHKFDNRAQREIENLKEYH